MASINQSQEDVLHWKQHTGLCSELHGRDPHGGQTCETRDAAIDVAAANVDGAAATVVVVGDADAGVSTSDADTAVVAADVVDVAIAAVAADTSDPDFIHKLCAKDEMLPASDFLGTHTLLAFCSIDCLCGSVA